MKIDKVRKALVEKITNFGVSSIGSTPEKTPTIITFNQAEPPSTSKKVVRKVRLKTA